MALLEKNRYVFFGEVGTGASASRIDASRVVASAAEAAKFAIRRGLAPSLAIRTAQGIPVGGWIEELRRARSHTQSERAAIVSVTLSSASRATGSALEVDVVSSGRRRTPPPRVVEEETRATRRFGSGFDSATAARAFGAERARKRDGGQARRGRTIRPTRPRSSRCARIVAAREQPPPRGRLSATEMAIPLVRARESGRSACIDRPRRLARRARRGRGVLGRLAGVATASRPTRPMSSQHVHGGTPPRGSRNGGRRRSDATRRRRRRRDAALRRARTTDLAYPTSVRANHGRAAPEPKPEASTRTSMKRTRSRSPRDESRGPVRRRRGATRRAFGRFGGGGSRARFDWRRGSAVWESLRRGGFARRIPGPAFGRGGADDGVS